MDPYQRRFGGLGRLYGSAGLERLRHAHVCIVGLGGVGSWAVEALARSGVGRLTLIDLDDVCISNVNRQLHALDGELGKPKVEVIARRAAAINPDCIIHPSHCFFLKSNAEQILKAGFDAVLDAIDSPSLKCLLIASCRQGGIPVTVVGGAGGRQDPTAIEVTDLAFSSGDRLLQQVRRKLRRDYGFPRGDQEFGIECVVSRESPVFPTNEGCVTQNRAEAADLRLDCRSGFGTASFVTGAFGLVAASRIVKQIASKAHSSAACRLHRVVSESSTPQKGV
ncbi:MAG TPA: tRNA threonylcarbamoyladenosine dehydratase [Patescibacteria group bacterium]|nr:tRNA threonylcarbamoyladenosine dehydratase [Patescibacteria group bacterium]